MIDPHLKTIIDGMAQSGFQLPDPLAAPAMRELMDTPLPSPPVEVADVRDIGFATPACTITARLYHPRPGEVLPVTVLMHGGGWVIGSLDTHDTLARVLARDAGCAVISVGYRLAPEHPFPAPLDDCLAIVAALPDRAAELGIDASRYAVAGDSAGGNLAAAIALHLRGRPDAPMAQLLFYPVMDADFDRPSYRTSGDSPTLSADMMRFFWNAYVGDSAPDERAAPLRAPDLTGAAPAIILLAGHDPLHDEGFAYAERLKAAGVSTDLHDFSSAVHGFASFFGMAPIADHALGIATAALARALG